MKKEIKNGIIIGYINMVANILVTLFFIPLMLKLMGQSEYGLYSLIASVVAYLSVLDMGFGNAMIRFVSRSQAKHDEQESKINGTFLILYAIVGILAIIIGIIVFYNFESIFSESLSANEISKAKILFIILLINVSVSFPLSVFDSYVVVNEKFTFAKVLALIKTLSKPLIMLPLLFLGYKSIAMAITITVVNLSLHIVSLLYDFVKLKMKISFNIKQYDKGLLKSIMAYSFFIFLNIIVDNIYNHTDQIILGIVSGTIAVSVYSIANQINQMNAQCSTTISGLFLPKITKMLEEKDSDVKVSNLFIKVSRIQLYVMLLIMSGFIVFGQQFINYWVGSGFKDAYFIVLILICPAIIPLTQNIGISIIQAKNMHKFRSVLYIMIAILNIFISIPLAKLYQGIGAAIGTAIANLLGQIIAMNIYYYKKIKIDIPRYWKFFIKLTFEIFVLDFIVVIILSKIKLSIFYFILSIVIYTFIYFLIAFFNMNAEEKKYISSIYAKIIRR